MADATFNVGDIVQLKSGGPKMTITSLASKDRVYTAWFAGSKNETSTFPILALVHVSDAPAK